MIKSGGLFLNPDFVMQMNLVFCRVLSPCQLPFKILLEWTYGLKQVETARVY